MTQGEKKDWLEEETEDYEGQLAIDVYQTEDDVIVKAPMAGVKPENLDVSITDEVLTIKGSRSQEKEINKENYFAQECYWGSFSRSYLLPVAIDPDSAQAHLKNGILTVTIPKQSKTKTRAIKVKEADE
jgi:HSP20 family protein